MTLIADPVMPGLRQLEGLVDVEEEHALIDHIESLGLSPFRFQGWTGKRLSLS